MRLITENGQLSLPSDFSFTVEKESPFFGDNGTASIPVQFACNANNMLKLNYPHRLSLNHNNLRKIKAKLEAGVFHKDGTLIVDSASVNDGITASIALDESDIYANFKDKSLTELFENHIRNDYSSADDKISSWINHFMSILSGTIEDDFVIGPVAVNKYQENNIVRYSYLNNVDITSYAEWYPLIYGSRIEYEDNEGIRVPKGYGITPFFYLHKFVVLLFDKMGYTLRANPFASHSIFSKIIMLNNTADTICNGVIKYSDIVPTCTVDEFIEFLNNKFHAQVFIYPELGVADIILFENIITSDYDIDISGIINGEHKVIFSDPEHISLQADCSIELSESASDTYDEFCKNNPIVKSLTEAEFLAASNYATIYRKALGRYYKVRKNPSTGDSLIEHIGTNNFNYNKKKMREVEIEGIDASVGMISYNNIVCPYIGERRNLNTSYENKDDKKSEQKIIIAYYAGKAEGSKYPLITNQKYNNIGNLWISNHLNYTDLYALCWKGYNELLMNSAVELQGFFNYNLTDLLRLRLDKLKHYKGQKLLPVNIKYEIGSNVKSLESSYKVLQLSNGITDAEPSFSEQVFIWRKYSDLDSILDKYDNPQINETTWEYADNTNTENMNIYMPAPISAGLTDFGSYIPIIVKVRDLFNNSVTTHYENLSVWYQSQTI